MRWMMNVAELRERTERMKAAGEIPPPEVLAARLAEKKPKTRPQRKIPLPVLCRHEGVILVPCESCGKDNRHIRDCEIHGQVTRIECGKDVDMTCVKCRKENLGYEPITSS